MTFVHDLGTMACCSIVMYVTGKIYVNLITEIEALRDIDERMAIRIGKKGDAALAEKRWEDAISFYSVAIRLKSNTNITYYKKRAEAYYEVCSFDKALEDCNTAIHLDSKDANTYILRGKTQEMLGNKEAANEDFGRARELNACRRWTIPFTGRYRNCLQRQSQSCPQSHVVIFTGPVTKIVYN